MSASRNIILRGGPMDGEMHTWHGGDRMEVAERPGGNLTPRTPAPAFSALKRGWYVDAGPEPSGFIRFEWKGWAS